MIDERLKKIHKDDSSIQAIGDYLEKRTGVNTFKCYTDSTSERSGKLFDKQIWRVSDVARFLDCSIGHIYNLVSDEKLPKIKRGKFLYFIPTEILNWVLKGEVQ